jgi:4'-phosphopantetheinyl transferase
VSGAVERTGAATAPALTVTPGDLHIWVLPRPWTHTDPAPLPVDELDDAERERAAGLTRTGDRVRYLSAHVALRRLLSAYTGIGPRALRLGRDRCPCCGGPHGRPVLLDRPRGPVPDWPHFSLSHSHQVAVVAFAGATVGVDVQRVPPANAVRLCLPDLHPAEQAELAAVPGRRRPAAFARLWTRKEAYLKGLGTGLRRDLAADYLGTADGFAAAAPVTGRRGAPRRPSGWSVTDVPGPPGHATAAAVRTAHHYRTVVRTLTADCLHAEDATELIADSRARVHRVPQAAVRRPQE